MFGVLSVVRQYIFLAIMVVSVCLSGQAIAVGQALIRNEIYISLIKNVALPELRENSFVTLSQRLQVIGDNQAMGILNLRYGQYHQAMSFLSRSLDEKTHGCH